MDPVAAQSGPAVGRPCVDGIPLEIDGSGPETLLLIHGWPDTCRVWDATVDAMRARYRCVRFTLPGFDLALPPRSPSLAAMVALLAAVADTVSPGRPLTLILHDWGCVFGYEYAARHPQRVARIVGIDIGDHNSAGFRGGLAPSAKVFVLAYQLWLASAWLIRGAAGTRMTRWMARVAGARASPATIGWQMNYPYAMSRFGVLGGLGGTAPVAPRCPLLFVYGERKPFMFHSRAWADALALRPECGVKGFATGHWIMNEQPGAFQQCVDDWLVATRRP